MEGTGELVGIKLRNDVGGKKDFHVEQRGE